MPSLGLAGRMLYRAKLQTMQHRRVWFGALCCIAEMRSAMLLLRQLKVCKMTLKIYMMTQKAGKCAQSPLVKPRILLRYSVAKSEKMACAN